MKVTLINPAVPELNALAPALAREKMLHAYVHPFLSTGRPWERALGRLPLAGRSLAGEFRRRQIPADLVGAPLLHAASQHEFARAALSRAPASVRAALRPLHDRLMYRRNAVLGEAGANAAAGADVVVAPYGTALESFARVSGWGGVRVLDYPVAHHRYCRRILRAEARRRPDLAGTISFDSWPQGVERRFDRECALADYILVGSSFVARSFIAEGIPPAKLVTIPYGVDVERFHPPEGCRPTSPFRVLFVGQIGQRKGIGYLLDAYRSFRREDTELLLAGNYVGAPGAFRAYDGLYRHAGHVPHHQLPPIFRSASVFVLPSLIEGMGLVVLEAMASGLPVIVTANGPGDIVRDGVDGFIVPACDARAIAERLELLYRDPALRRRMGAQARERALHFTWQRYTDLVIGFLREVTAARKAGLCA